MLKTKDINIRDPFILVYNNEYYMYATNNIKKYANDPNLGRRGFMVYRSSDLENWEEPVAVTDFPNDFWADCDYWAPEVHEYKGNFYLFASLKSETRQRGTQIFKSSSPTGIFEPISNGPVTLEEWSCLDGTLYLDKRGTPYMVFCHEWTQIGNGAVCYMQLSEDLTHAVTEPKVMFSAADYPFVRAFPREDCYVTDGPFLYRCNNGDLVLIWSSFGDGEYLESVLKSDNGEINGKWIALPCLFDKNGGHGMLFKTLEGDLKLSLHSPNNPDGAERLKLIDIIDDNGKLRVK